MNRRRFLKQAGLWVPAAIAFPAIVRAQRSPFSDPARVATMTHRVTGPSFTYYSASFDGSTYLNHAGGIGSDSYYGLFSGWFKLTDTAATEYNIIDHWHFQVNVFSVTFYYGFQCKNSDDATTTATARSTNGFKNTTWHHFLFSFDTSGTPGFGYLYVDGNAETAGATWASATTTDYDNAQPCRIGIRRSGVLPWIGLMSEVWFNTEYLDITVQANREKFRSSSGHPVNLGSNGSTPTGNQPLLYFHKQVPNWHDNSGSAGAFTMTGTLVDGGADIP